jgi:uncharacterized protein (DUF4213/DUF364 family)
MNILDEILSSLPDEPVAVRKVIIGVHWTLVCSKRAGLGSTLVNCGPHGHSHMREVGDLLNKIAQELAGWIKSDNLLEASVGIAAINSLLDVEDSQLVEINAAEVLARRATGKNLAIVGHFPFVEKIKSKTSNCWVIEKRPYGDDFPEEAASQFLPQADVVAITGTSLINHSVESLLSLCKPDSVVMLLGPSTPLTPVLLNRGIAYLSGSRVIDEESAALTIQQGASFPQVKGVKVVTLSTGK